ncbi:MAG TPA: hypothetical protein VKT77_11090 [Chthonomonadaceae bacterium]|nr:hypothetical protein [Chthonomonadaceae bacterium]
MAIELLVCAATAGEIAAFGLPGDPLPDDGAHVLVDGGRTALAVTGVGAPCTLMRLPALLDRLRPAAALTIGIAGAYPDSGYGVGEVVMARSECWADVGFELPDEPGFRHVSESPFGGFYQPITLTLDARFLPGPEGVGNSADIPADIPIVAAATVNTCTGTRRTGLLRGRLFSAEIENMEGAAFGVACAAAGIPACEVRAISNIAGDRDMRPDNIGAAIARLARHLRACRERMEER